MVPVDDKDLYAPTVATGVCNMEQINRLDYQCPRPYECLYPLHYIGSHWPRPDTPVLCPSSTGPLVSVMRVLLSLLLAHSVFAGRWCEHFTL